MVLGPSLIQSSRQRGGEGRIHDCLIRAIFQQHNTSIVCPGMRSTVQRGGSAFASVYLGIMVNEDFANDRMISLSSVMQRSISTSVHCTGVSAS